MKFSEMRELLAQRGIHLTKSLGQNFLHDGNQLRRIVRAAELAKADKVLEIGPGLGPLTEILLAEAGKVLAIEKDRRLVEFLRDRFGLERRLQPVRTVTCAQTKPPEAGTPNLDLLHDDALEFLRREPRDWADWKLVANLPYSVASPLLVELAQNERGPQRMVVTLQLEVAQRLGAQAGDSHYGLLALLVQLRYRFGGLFKIPATCFFPEPDVDSAGVILVRRPQPLLTVAQSEAFVKIVKRAFSQRRKMMLKLLKEEWPAEILDGAFREARLLPQVRAEAVGLDQFVQLTKTLTHE